MTDPLRNTSLRKRLSLGLRVVALVLCALLLAFALR